MKQMHQSHNLPMPVLEAYDASMGLVHDVEPDKRLLLCKNIGQVPKGFNVGCLEVLANRKVFVTR